MVDRVGATVVIATRDLIEIFGIERPGERCRTHDIAKKNREVPCLAVCAVKPFEVRVATAKLAPQLPQNLLFGEFTAPH